VRLRIWNAYASNNSGSYTIVGSLPSNEVAQEVAQELAALIDAHTAWLAAQHTSGGDSPLAAFCRSHGLAWAPGEGEWDEWPEYSQDNRPRIAVAQNQIVIHHEYTVSLPKTFGEYFYKRGGRVNVEENHAHHPIVTTAQFWWGWTKEQRAQGEIELPRLLAWLTAPDGALMQGADPKRPAAWQVKDHGPALMVGAVFENLIDGVSALSDAAKRHGAQMQLRLVEAPDDRLDPLMHMRPSSPAAVPRFDVIIRAIGENEDAVKAAIFGVLSLPEWTVREALSNLPGTLVRSISQDRAEAVAGAMRKAGATADVVRNDG